MSDADAAGTATGESSPAVAAAMDDALGRSVLTGRSLAVGAAVVVAWWQLVGGPSVWIAALGAVTLTFGLDAAATALASRRWPTAEAVVVGSAVLTRRAAEERAPGSAGGGSTGGYVPLVRYEYDVDGETYESARVSPFDGAVPRYRWASAVVDDYPRNRFVTARHDPDDPSRAYLRSWVPTPLFLASVLGSVAFFGAAAWFAVDTPGGAPVATFAVGVPTFLLGVRQLRRALASRGWPTTAGEVTGTEVDSRSGGESGSTSYVPKLRYEYEVEGTTYASSRYAFGGGPSFSSRSEAEAWLDAYPVGGEVAVHYDPDRPDVSVLEPGGLRSLFLVGFGLLWLGFGTYVVLQSDLSALPF